MKTKRNPFAHEKVIIPNARLIYEAERGCQDSSKENYKIKSKRREDPSRGGAQNTKRTQKMMP